MSESGLLFHSNPFHSASSFLVQPEAALWYQPQRLEVVAAPAQQTTLKLLLNDFDVLYREPQKQTEAMQ